MPQIFVGGLDPSVSEEYLRQVFGAYGQLEHVKIPVGKRCGFVQFAERYIAVAELIYQYPVGITGMIKLYFLLFMKSQSSC